jgi:CDP-diacylglycerol--serine O-phosphatidyltransferase
MNVSDLKPREPRTQEQARLVAFQRLIPNLMTLGAIAMGLTAIQMAFMENWERAIVAILIAVILDTLDGTTARLLKATSEFGAQLDSLSDFLAFGVAPAVILYSWILEESGKIGWIAMIVYAAACALRLARFNITQKELPDWKKGFFSGIPSPAGAGLALLPLIIWIQQPHFFEQFAFASPLVGLWTIAIAALMVSRIPTYSTKRIKLPAKFGMPALALAAVIFAALLHAPWVTLTIAAFFYMASLPFAVRHFRKLQKIHADEEDLTDLALGAIVIEDIPPPEKQDAP